MPRAVVIVIIAILTVTATATVIKIDGAATWMVMATMAALSNFAKRL